MSNLINEFNEIFNKKLITKGNTLPVNIAGFLDIITKQLDKVKIFGNFKWMVNKSQ